MRALLLAGSVSAAMLLGDPVSAQPPASAQPPPSAQPRKTFVYRCDDGTQLTASFPRSRFAQISLDGKTTTLTQRLAASGARYSKRRMSFWIKGREATLTRGRQSTVCRTD
jgi:membrane-bound inhibitor of C-type lysozyme